MKWVKYDCNGDEQVWYSDDEVEKLEAENAELKAYMDVNEDFKTAWEELKALVAKRDESVTAQAEIILKLKAENERLKEEIQEINQAWEDIAEARIEICNQCGERTDYNIPCKQIRDLDYGLQLEIAENEKLKETLQEIKKIAEKELSYDMIGNEHRHYRNYDFIRHLITKAESEEV